MRSRVSWRVLFMSNCNFSMAPTYFTRNSAHVSDVLLPTKSVYRIISLEKKRWVEEERGKRRDWPELLVESVSRLATVLDLESPPKLESTDYTELETWEGVSLNSTRRKWLCHDIHVCVLLYFAFGADLTALRAAAAVALFDFPEHRSPWRPHPALQPASATWIITDHSVKHTIGLTPQVSTEMMNNWM